MARPKGSKALTLVPSEGGDVAVRDIQESAQVARAQAEIQAAFIMAARFPRSEAAARARIDQSLDRLGFAEDCFYSFPRAGKSITGPSINLARALGQSWGNLRHGYIVVHDDDEDRTIEGFAWDLETNAHVSAQDSFKKLIQRRDAATQTTKWVVPDERDLRELTSRRAAILVRNCILQLIPRDVTDDFVGKARATVARGDKTKDLPTRRAETVKAFSDMGITQQKIEDRLGHSVDEMTPDEIADLRGAYKAIQDNVAKREEYFPNAAKVASQKPPQNAESTLADLIGPGAKVVSEDRPATKEPPAGVLGNPMGMRLAIQQTLLERNGSQPEAASKELHGLFGVRDVTMLRGPVLSEAYYKIVRDEEVPSDAQ